MSDRHRKSSASGSAIAVTRSYIETGDLSPLPASASFITAPGTEVVVPDVAVGDNITAFVGLMWDATSAQFLDLAVSRDGSLVRFSSSGDATAAVEGDPALYNTPATYRTSGTVFGFTATADDIHTDGTVTLVVATRGNGTGTLFLSANFPLRWEVWKFVPAA